jgi:geranylgeranyl reductase family protein
MRYDVIIVGSGPAGASAAISLSRGGRSVLVLEKSKHPRHKSCGGGLSARLLPYLDGDIKEVIEEEIFRVAFTFKKKQVSVPSPSPIAYLVRRERFDACLVEKARSAGAEVREETSMQAWRENAEGVEVQTGQGWERASYLIGADGSQSQVARRLHPSWKRNLACSIEAEAPVGGERGEVLIDLSVPRGYGWVFPRRGDAAIGVADLRGRPKRPRLIYGEFLLRRSLPSSEAPSGSTLPLFGRSPFPLVRGRTLLVGDAASLVDPLFGEGIYYAVRSGQMAAGAIASALADPSAGILSYDREARAVLYPEFEVAARLAGWVYAFPSLFLEAVRRHPRGMGLYYEVLKGERSYPEFWKAIQKEFLKRLNPFRRIFATPNRP